ncbi:uncharacterized protein LOC131437745 [Malaya genurostris]|uniref:uncharacterized protein LOC131437745 n=1 Tax=Malaya genurostris TaxID=325434 RepID=UPI0026F3FC2E|nr:uncharacterized protein LOC131437745 [Malaya genurostris]XP_058463275.1 uncharacterized protein LOC131437745 [Malaya genurostris]
MEFKSFYKNASRCNRLKDSNNQRLKSKRESSRQDLHFNNRNLKASDSEIENDEVFYTNSIQRQPGTSSKKRRRSAVKDENKENEIRCKYEERLARLLRFKEERAKAKQLNSVKKKPFVSVVPKNNLVDREYEKNLFKKSETELKTIADKRKVLTPAAKYATPRVDTRRKEPFVYTTDKEQQKKNKLNLRTPASISAAKPKVDTWRKGPTPVNDGIKRKEQNKIGAILRSKTAEARTTTSKTKPTVISNKTNMRVEPTARVLTTYQAVRLNQKSFKFNFLFAKDGPMITSTNRKKKSLEKSMEAAEDKQKQKTYRFSPKVKNQDDDIFEGISPIDVDTPTPKKVLSDTESIAMRKRETRRRSMIFTVEDLKQTEVKHETRDEWEPQVITISDEESDHESLAKKQVKKNASFIVNLKEEKLVDRRPKIEPMCNAETINLVGSGRKLSNGRSSLVFIETRNTSNANESICNVTVNIPGRNSMGFVEEINDPVTLTEPIKFPKTAGNMDPSQRQSKTSRFSFTEEDVTANKPLPEGNLATILLNKHEIKQRNSGGSRCSSVISFREDDQPPTDVLEKVTFYNNLVEKELKRLQQLCDLYKSDVENEAIDENSKGLIIAAQGQTQILINKKLSKFKELVKHYEQSWTDQKVRTDDLDGFWLMVSLDLENLDRRFEELRLLKQNDWQEIAEQPKVKKLKCGAGIKKREKKPMKTKASGLADLIKKAREEAKKKLMMESVLKESVTVLTPAKRSVRIATTPRRSSLNRRSICAGCTPTSGKSNKTSRKTIFNDHTLRYKEVVKSILKTPSEKRRAKSVLFLDSGLDTPETRRSDGRRKIVHTPKPKITFNEELEVEDVETISITTPYKLDEEIRKRRRSSICSKDISEEHSCTRSSRRRTLRFTENIAVEEMPTHEREQDLDTSAVINVIEEKGYTRRTTRGTRK